MSDMNTTTQEIDIITLATEDGEEYSFELLAYVKLNEKNYAVVVPFDAEGDDEAVEEVVIFEAIPVSEDEEEYIEIDDENTISAVFDLFKAEYGEAFDFED